MNTAIINLKIEPKVKKEAKKMAADLGLSLSGMINACIKQIIRTKTVYLSLNEDNPSPILLNAVKTAEAERKGKKHRQVFLNANDAIKSLDK